jgi:hypothetical protein
MDLRPILKSQYHSSLAMLRQAIEMCPDAEWNNATHTNAFWQIAYHALFFAHVYLMPNEAAFVPWREHQTKTQNPDGLPGPDDPSRGLPLLPQPYTKSQVLEYWSICDSMINAGVDALDLESPESGFHWYPISKLEHQLVNIRHIQHHAAQLADRVRASTGEGVKWVGRSRN